MIDTRPWWKQKGQCCCFPEGIHCEHCKESVHTRETKDFFERLKMKETVMIVKDDEKPI